METVKTEPVYQAAGSHSANSGDGAFREARAGWLTLVLVWLASAVYLGLRLRHGWVPSDAGTLAQTADRVLRGQVPYRDFIDSYTGGLDFLNALAFHLFGVNLFSLRIPFFLFFLGWVPSVYFIARRFAGPLGAGLVTLLSVAWSVPNYPEAMPSWYNLFFATWGVLVLIRYVETERRVWLWVAGVCGGLSFLFKISGLYFVAAALLFFVFREEELGAQDEASPQRKAIFYQLFVTAGLLAFLAALIRLVSRVPVLTNYVHFVLPSACLVALLAWAVWRHGSGRSGPRFRRLLRMGLPFLTGLLAPVFIFLVWFAENGALVAWLRGTFITPGVRLEWASGVPTPLAIMVGLLPPILIVLLAFDSRESSRRLVRVAAPTGMGVLLLASWKFSPVYLLVGFSLPLLVPLLALAAPFVLARLAGAQRQRVFLVVAAAALCALVQFPAPGAIYFNYVAPLAILALLALFPSKRTYDRLAVGSLLAFYLLFALLLHTPGYFETLHQLPDRAIAFSRLNLRRSGGLMVDASQAREYERLVSLVRRHAQGDYIYAGPDAPEVYFLTGLDNPTRTLFDTLDPDFLDVPARNDRILNRIAKHGVNVVVIRLRRILSAPISAGLRAALDSEFPSSERVGDFEVRWRSEPTGGDPRLRAAPEPGPEP